jgi:ATP-dependent Clp protease ATP-binding subunit ClpC
MEFTPRAKIAFGHAEAEAHALAHPSVGSQHLIFGLFLLGSGVHFSVLRQLGFTAESLRREIVTVGPTAENTKEVRGFVFGISAAEALERADQEAAAMSHTYTGTEHILLGLLTEESGGAARLFTAHNADVAKARQIILNEYQHPT